MKSYYITEQLVYVSVDETEFHEQEYCNEGQCFKFRAHVYTNALNNNAKAHFLCGVKVKDDVLVTLPVTTPRIVF